MGFKEMVKEENFAVEERNELVVERIRQILDETAVEEKYLDYFKKAAEKILFMERIYEMNEKGEFHEMLASALPIHSGE